MIAIKGNPWYVGRVFRCRYCGGLHMPEEGDLYLVLIPKHSISADCLFCLVRDGDMEVVSPDLEKQVLEEYHAKACQESGSIGRSGLLSVVPSMRETGPPQNHREGVTP